MCFNYSQSSEISKYECTSKKYKEISTFGILHTYNQDYLVFFHNMLGSNFINFGNVTSGVIRSFMSSPNESSLLMYEMSEEKDNKRSLTFIHLMSNKIENLNSQSIFYGKTVEDKSNLELTNEKLKDEINNFQINRDYVDDLLNNRSDQINDELTEMDEYSCEKLNNETIDNSKNIDSDPLKFAIESIKTNCIGDNPYEKHKIFCNCYGDWFYKNLNKDEISEFLFTLNEEDKIKFVEEKNIVKQCKLYSEYPNLINNDKAIIKKQ